MSDLLTWGASKKMDLETDVDNSVRSRKLDPKMFWTVFEQYLTTADDSIAEELLKQLISCTYPPITYLIDSLSYDYNYRQYFNELLNDSSQTWLYKKECVFRLLRNLYKTGFFVWIPKKAYSYTSYRARQLYPWLSSQELQIIDQQLEQLKTIEKQKVDDNVQNKNITATSQSTSPTKQVGTIDVKERQYYVRYDELVNLSVKNDQCKNCPHFSQPQVFGDIKDKTKPVDILFVGEAPHTEEVKQGKPFVGSSGKILRSCIEQFIPPEINWAIWNASLCQVLPKKANLSTALECCRSRLFKAIEMLDPRLVVLLGGSAYEGIFGSSANIAELRGRLLNKDGISILVTYHPAAALHNPKMKETVIESISSTIRHAVDLVEYGNSLNCEIVTNRPDWFSEYIKKGYKLLDVQDFDDILIYVFKDSNNRRVVVKNVIDGSKPCYYYYQYNKEATLRPIVPICHCSLIAVYDLKTYRQTRYDERGYHSDIPLSTRHAIDYYLHANLHQLSQDYNLAIGYVDIEVLPKDRVTFPNEETAEDPIVAISYTVDNGTDDITIYTWFLQNKNKPVQTDKTTFIFDDEISMLKAFLEFVKKSDPDIIAGWNIFFDLNYIITRCKRLGINADTYLSPVNKTVIDRQRRYVFIGGRIVIDMLHTYKQLTFERKSSYALNYIANEELGYGKVEFEGPLMTLYDRDPELFLKYNKQDVQLLVELERKLNYIYFMDQLRKLIKGTWLNLVSTSSQCDTMLVSYLEDKGLVAQAKKYAGSQDVFKGAFVYQPKPGIREWVFDLDYASLYPNIIRSFNIGIDTFYAFIPNEDIVEKYLFGDKTNIDKIPIIFDPLYNDTIKTITVEELDKLREKCLITPNGCLFLRQNQQRSIMYDLLTLLLNERKVYKKKKAEAKERGDKDAKKKYHVMQWTYKIIANSFYGYLGFEHSRIHDRRVAAAVTSVGRTVIKTGLAWSEQIMEQLRNPEFSLDINKEILNDEPEYKHVLYGDTDSLFITLDGLLDVIDPEEFVTTKLKEVEAAIDESVRQYLKDVYELDEVYFELKNEWIARRFLQTSRKKRYAYLLWPDNKIKVVGIEVKRSDQPPVVRTMLEELLYFLLLQDNLTPEAIANRIEEYTHKYELMLKDRIPEAGKPMAANFDKENLPQCRAAKNWNELEYQYFKQGTRGFYFHLIGVDVSKIKKRNIKDILVPPETVKVPEYYVINVEKMINDYWLKKVEAILSEIIPNAFVKMQKKLSASVVNLMTW